MSPSVRLTQAAKRDIDLAFAWYEQQRRGLGDEFLEAVEKCLDGISRHPGMHAIVRKDLRLAKVTRFPYLIIYRFMADRIRISAVVHASRHPRNWQDQG